MKQNHKRKKKDILKESNELLSKEINLPCSFIAYLLTSSHSKSPSTAPADATAFSPELVHKWQQQNEEIAGGKLQADSSFLPQQTISLTFQSRLRLLIASNSSDLQHPVVTPPEFSPHPLKLSHRCHCLCLRAETNLQYLVHNNYFQV